MIKGNLCHESKMYYLRYHSHVQIILDKFDIIQNLLHSIDPRPWIPYVSSIPQETGRFIPVGP